MPQALDNCVNSLLSKWKEDPASRPKPKEEGQEAKSQAHAICTSTLQKAQKMSNDIMLGEGLGPTIVGSAATNRPYIPQLEAIKVEGKEGEEKLLLHLANPGFFNHPLGAFSLNRAVFSTMITNFTGNVVGQAIALDARHKPEHGALAWFEELYIDDKNRFFAKAKPTPTGLKLVEGGEYRYCSMEFARNYDRDDIRLDLERATDDACLLDLAEGGDVGLKQTIATEDQGANAAIKELEGFIASGSDLIDFGNQGKDFPLVDGHFYVTKGEAKALLDALQQKAKLENDVDNFLALFNPYHDDSGRFATKQGNRTGGVGAAVSGAGKKVSEYYIGRHERAARGIRKEAEKVAGPWDKRAAEIRSGSKLGKAFVAGNVLADAITVGLGAALVASMIVRANRWLKGTSLPTDDFGPLNLEHVELFNPCSDEDSEEDMEKMEKLQETITRLEAEATEREEQALKLEQGTIDERVKNALKLAGSYVDSEGNGYPRFLLEWAGKLMRFEDFGADENVVRLSDDDRPSMAMQGYVIAAVEELMDKIPGTVPLERKSKDDDSADSDDYDYGEAWEDV